MKGAYLLSVPTLGERIVDHLTTNGESLDDGELADALGVRRPVIAETCRQLEAEGRVVRNMAGGTRTVAVVPPGPVVPPAPPAPAPPAPSDPPAPPSEAAPGDGGDQSVFPAHARRVLSARWGTGLQRRHAVLPGGVAHPFELVSGNGRIVGDVVWLADRGGPAGTGSAVISEAVLIVGHVTNADRRFLVFDEERDALSRWLARYRLLLDGVEMWFLDGDRLERLA